MSIKEYLIIYVLVLLAMLVSRILPVAILKGRDLHPTFIQALNLIPPAAFAALVANDLFNPEKISTLPVWSWASPLVAAAVVMVVSAKTKSMAASIVVGVGLLALLMYAPGIL